MKKLLSIFVAGLLLFGLVSATSSDLPNWLDTLSALHDEIIPFGYIMDQKISVEQITSSKVVIKSPVIQDEFGTIIKKYTVLFSPYTIDEMIDKPSLLDEAKEKTFEFTTVSTTITMELNLSDQITPTLVYYVTVIPKDENNMFGEASHNELRFKLATQTHGDGTYSDTVNNIAKANMELANVTHSHNTTNNILTLKWTAVQGADKVDISSYNPTSDLFERLAIVNMSDESYSFLLTRNGEYIIDLTPNNGGQKYRLQFIIDGVTSSVTPNQPTTPPVIGKIPATGPKENVLLVLAISVVLYIVYRRVKAKAK